MTQHVHRHATVHCCGTTLGTHTEHRSATTLLLLNKLQPTRSSPVSPNAPPTAAHIVGFQQAHADLDAPPLPIRHGVQALVNINVQQLYEAAAAVWVHSLHAKYHLAGGDISLEGHAVACKGHVLAPGGAQVAELAAAGELLWGGGGVGWGGGRRGVAGSCVVASRCQHTRVLYMQYRCCCTSQ